ncbi:MAG: hypothetical protein ACU836_02315 [Gammaproteobacteria bacterium]
MNESPDYIFNLPLPGKPKTVRRDRVIQPGFRYHVDAAEPDAVRLSNLEYDLENGLIGDYRLDCHATEMLPIDSNARPIKAFVWDTDLLPSSFEPIENNHKRPESTATNRLTLVNVSLDAPNVGLIHNLPVLTITPRFELEWCTEAHGSQLGLVQLVESARTMITDDGKSHVLLNTETAGSEPVLYLTGPADDQPIKPACPYQQQGQTSRFQLGTPVSQVIPNEVDGNSIHSLSVLEKYTVYFMQNAKPEQPEQHIWVPVYLPIVWGWSIRVQQRSDGLWDIFRKKLIMPIPSTEAIALPRWRNNSLRCRGSDVP